jgi:hypothetical protein
MFYRPFLLLLFLFPFLKSNAQSDDHTHSHYDHKNEIGIANAPVYFLKEKELSYAMHIHLVRRFQETDWAYGLGYEKIFDEHNHQTYSGVLSYRPTERWVFNAAPGVTFEENDTSELNFALHIESSYEFELGDFHIGPAAELAYDPEDIHFSIGLHVGYGF